MSLSDLVKDYDELLNLMFLVLNSLKGKPLPDDRYADSERLAKKIFVHAVTAGNVRRGSDVRLDAYPEGAHIRDFASVIVIARAIFETYINMFQVFFEPLTDDEFEYRHAVYQIAGFRIRETFIPTDPPSNLRERIEQQIKQNETIRNRIRNTSHFQTVLDISQRKASLDGSICPVRGIVDIAEAAGFARNFIEHQWSFLSAYTHGDALSISQIDDAKDANLVSFYMTPIIGLVMMVLAKLILEYQSRSTEAATVCNQHPETMKLVSILSTLASTVGDTTLAKGKKL